MNLFYIFADLLNGSLVEDSWIRLSTSVFYLFDITSHVASGKLYYTLVKEQADKGKQRPSYHENDFDL